MSAKRFISYPPRFADLIAKVSLTIAIAFVGLWIHSWNITTDEFGFQNTRIYGCCAFGGEIYFSTSRDAVTPQPARLKFFIVSPRNDGVLLTGNLMHRFGNFFADFGVVHASGFDGQRRDFRAVMLPLWFFVALFTIVPLGILCRYLASRRKYAPGLCQVCGYDLRASLRRCPECGTPFNDEDREGFLPAPS